MKIWSLIGGHEELAVLKDEAISELKDAEACQSLHKLIYWYPVETDKATVGRLMGVVEASLLSHPCVIGAVVSKPLSSENVFLAILVRGSFAKIPPFITRKLCQVARQSSVTIEDDPLFRTIGDLYKVCA